MVREDLIRRINPSLFGLRADAVHGEQACFWCGVTVRHPL